MKLYKQELTYSYIKTPLGEMIAIADKQRLHLLCFTNPLKTPLVIDRYKAKEASTTIPNNASPIITIMQELDAYFKHKLYKFKTPLALTGTNFQNQVWHTLLSIPYGHTSSYNKLAINIGKPSACRAVANANAANQIAIVIPCHRIVKSTGEAGGYNAGIERKQWLLNHEKKHV